MEIELRLFATLTKYLPPEPEAYRVPGDTTVEKLLIELGIPREETKLIFINGKKHELDYWLSQGDRVGIFPPVGGG
ncbi:MAG: MoaD/ThiS family protein [Desulfobacteraceae bacterium]|nr:MoaD/ThiS family protein [Desulfobacteraceae bacterium]